VAKFGANPSLGADLAPKLGARFAWQGHPTPTLDREQDEFRIQFVNLFRFEKRRAK
jgi:hypothetical protein